MAATVRDVAKQAGVSVATVSRVLNSPAVVALHTKERVLAAISVLGYTPNLAAASLRRNHRKNRDRPTQTSWPDEENSSGVAASGRPTIYRQFQQLKRENNELRKIIRRFSTIRAAGP
jgi:hypothetical protein